MQNINSIPRQKAFIIKILIIGIFINQFLFSATTVEEIRIGGISTIHQTILDCPDILLQSSRKLYDNYSLISNATERKGRYEVDAIYYNTHNSDEFSNKYDRKPIVLNVLKKEQVRADLFKLLNFNSSCEHSSNIQNNVQKYYKLNPYYPVPFSPSTLIYCISPCNSYASLIISDIAGCSVKTGINETHSARNKIVKWNNKAKKIVTDS